MAIIPDLPGLEVNVCIDETSLEEFDDKGEEEEEESPQPQQADATKSISKYIKSVADQEFVIKWSAQDPFKVDSPRLSFDVVVDGKGLVSRSFGRNMFSDGVTEGFVKGVEYLNEGGQGMRLPFQFSKVKTTLDEDAYRNVDRDMERMAKTGSIVIKVWRCGDGTSKPLNALVNELQRNAEIHEKALKGEPKYHSFSYGDAEHAKINKTQIKARKLDKDPLASFTFKYRSEELLVIERTPEPEQPLAPETTDSVDLDELDAEQKRKVAEFVRNLKSTSSQGPRIKRERTDEDIGPSQSKKPKKSREKIMIDLSDD